MRQRTRSHRLVCHSRSSDGVTQVSMCSRLQNQRHVGSLYSLHLAVLHVLLRLLTFKGLFLTFLCPAVYFLQKSRRCLYEKNRCADEDDFVWTTLLRLCFSSDTLRTPSPYAAIGSKNKMSRSEKGHNFNDAASSGFTVMFNTEPWKHVLWS